MVVARFDGVKEGVSPKGTAYADVYYREVDENGNAVLDQSKYRTFDAGTIAVCKMLKVGEMISVDLEIRDALVRGVNRVDMEG